MLLRSLNLAVFFLLNKSSICSALRPAGLLVNCSSSNLMELPLFPFETTELHLQHNHLTFVSPGFFDRFTSLNKVSLSGNPFHCDCRIQYLRSWLLCNKALISDEPVCFSPSSVAQRYISELPDDFFSTCKLPSCASAAYTIMLGVMVCGVILMLLWTLKLARRSTIILSLHERHSGLEADSLRPLRPKHRGRLYRGPNEEDFLTWTDELERSLISMELLPQVLDALHKKHDIKIKSS